MATIKEQIAERRIDREHVFGRQIVDVFNLKKLPNGRYYTAYGEKTAYGLSLLVSELAEKRTNYIESGVSL